MSEHGALSGREWLCGLLRNGFVHRHQLPLVVVDAVLHLLQDHILGCSPQVGLDTGAKAFGGIEIPLGEPGLVVQQLEHPTQGIVGEVHGFVWGAHQLEQLGEVPLVIEQRSGIGRRE